MPSEKLEKLKKEMYVAEKKKTAEIHKGKRLEKEMELLTRKAVSYTHLTLPTRVAV